MRIKTLFILGALVLITNTAFAATRTWTGDGADALASNALNWDGGASAPAAGDDVVFDGVFAVTGNDPCTWNITTNLNTIDIQSGYTGTITLTATMSVTNVTGSLTINGTGTFNSNGQDIDVKSVDASGSATKTITTGSSRWIVAGNFNISGANLTFNYNTSEMSISEAATITTKSGNEFYKLTTGANRAMTFGSDVVVNNTLSISPYGNAVNGLYTIYAKGNIVSVGNGASGVNQTVINITGTANQTWNTPVQFSFSVTIDKSAGTLTISTGMVYGAGTGSYTFTHTAGTVVCEGTFSLRGTGTQTFNTSGMSFNNFTIGTAETPTVSLTSALNVTGNLALSLGTFAPGSQTVTVGGNWTKTSGTFTAGTSTVLFNGTSTIDGSTAFYNLTCSGTCSFDDADTFSTNASGVLSGNGTFQSDDASNTVDLNVNGTETVASGNCTRVDNSGTSVVTSGTITTCTGWAPDTFHKTINGLARASVKTLNGLAIASVKTVDGLS